MVRVHTKQNNTSIKLVLSGVRKMDYKFVCFGTFDKQLYECMIKCPYREECEQTKMLRMLKKDVEENAKNNKDKVLS